jgi:hypothetical protein
VGLAAPHAVGELGDVAAFLDAAGYATKGVVIADVHIEGIAGFVVNCAAWRGGVGHAGAAQGGHAHGGAVGVGVDAREPALGIVAVVHALQPAPYAGYLVGVQVFFDQFVAVVVVVFGYVRTYPADGGDEVGAAACVVKGDRVLGTETACGA